MIFGGSDPMLILTDLLWSFDFASTDVWRDLYAQIYGFRVSGVYKQWFEDYVVVYDF